MCAQKNLTSTGSVSRVMHEGSCIGEVEYSKATKTTTLKMADSQVPGFNRE